MGRPSRGAPDWKVDLFRSLSEVELLAYCSAMLSAYAGGGRWAPHEVVDAAERPVLERVVGRVAA